MEKKENTSPYRIKAYSISIAYFISFSIRKMTNLSHHE